VVNLGGGKVPTMILVASLNKKGLYGCL